MPIKRRQRRHGDAPAGWKYRDGRPRWEPAPGLRKAGWRGMNLQDGAGQWLSRGASIDAADAIARAVEAWRGGEPVPAHLSAIAPPGACDPAAAPAAGGVRDPFSLGVLLDDYLEDLGKRRAAGTVRDYRGKLARLVDAFAGFADLPGRKDAAGQARRAAAVAAVRGMSIFSFAPAETKAGLYDPWTAAYEALRAHAGVGQAYGSMAAAGAFLTWVNRRRTRKVPGKGTSWASAVERQTPQGRIVTWTWPEVAAVIAAADAMGRASIGDAVVLALDLGWSQVDVLALTWAQIDGTRVAGARQKTGRKGATPLLATLGQRRLLQIRARQAALRAAAEAAGRPPPALPHVIVCEATGRRWGSDNFRRRFAEVRARAAADNPALPALADKQFLDLRDTLFTWGRKAGLDHRGVASRTFQSLGSIGQLEDRHYGEIDQETADAAALLLEAELERMGVRL
jgi:hypothetical protein